MAVDAPRVLGDVGAVPGAGAGAVWRLAHDPRDLDANVISLPAGESIAPHLGADLDVLVLVLHGDGVLLSDRGEEPVRAGQLIWLPRRSRRGFRPGPEGLRYLTVHQRRTGLPLVAAERTD
jgi:quercetin dioxygenase-like cupin family protein